MTRLRILLTNDDGYQAEGIRIFFEVLTERFDVTAVAPSSERSAIAHAITFKRPLRCDPLPESSGMRGYRVFGTPADCVKLGVDKLLDPRPDLVVSGINLGENSGIAVYYSGTVGAAREGAFWGIPSFAFSVSVEEAEDIRVYARRAPDLIERILSFHGEQYAPGERGVFYNINFPACPPADCRGVRVARQSLVTFDDTYLKVEDPDHGVEYVLVGDKHELEADPEYDSRALLQGWITVTPCNLDTTSEGELKLLRDHIL